MARARNIKPGFFKNEILGSADPLLMILFEGLWVLSDREGRLENRPLRIKAEIFPYRDGIDVAGMLNWLDANGFVKQYEVSGQKYIQIANFVKHQNPHKNEAPSEIPSPDKNKRTSVKIGKNPEITGADTTKNGTNHADSLNLIPDSLNTDHPQDKGFALPAWIDSGAWSDFEAMRKKARKPMTDRAKQGIVDELEKLDPSHAQTAEILLQSVRNSWQDVYPLKVKAGQPYDYSTVAANIKD